MIWKQSPGVTIIPNLVLSHMLQGVGGLYTPSEFTDLCAAEFSLADAQVGSEPGDEPASGPLGRMRRWLHEKLSPGLNSY